MSHVHAGRDLKTLLERIRAWVSGLGRQSRGGFGGALPPGDAGRESLGDFVERRDALSGRLEGLLERMPRR